MPLSDISLVLRWWGALFLIGAAAFPLTRQLFSADGDQDWTDQGYFFAKAVGFAVITWFVYTLGMAHLAPFTPGTIIAVTGVVFLAGILLNSVTRNDSARSRSLGIRAVGLYVIEEIFFLGALFLWAYIKAHEPSIRGLEKFMDFGFMQSILNSQYFPPADMWYPPNPINYYYFGHLVTALVTKLAGLDLLYSFNLMLCTLFALTLTMSFAIGRFLLRRFGRLVSVGGGLLTAWLVTLAGNMQTVYAFTRGYDGEQVKPFWTLVWGAGELVQKFPEGWSRYWYANATRFIPFTIHEFPSYSFVVSDIHGHVLSLPFVLLAIGLLFVMFGTKRQKHFTDTLNIPVFYGFLVGVLLMTNALDGPIYFGLFGILFIATNARVLLRFTTQWKAFIIPLGAAILAAVLSALPFLSHFSSFVTGIAVNCPPAFLANSKIGPILFEGIDKCQKSPLWMMWLLWGFFWYAGVIFLIGKLRNISELRKLPHYWNTRFTHEEQVLIVMFLFSIVLIVFPEFLYFKDIYPQHFRSNTMFKLGYQAFIMWSIFAGYTIVGLIFPARNGIHKSVRPGMRKLFLILLIPQLALVSIYPSFSIRNYFAELKTYDGIYGLSWLAREYPDDFAALYWLKGQPKSSHENILEADGDSYTDYERFSAFSGIATPIGWGVHEWLWRGSYDVVAPRKEDVRLMYETDDPDKVSALLDQYQIRYIIVGSLEREKFTSLREETLAQLGGEVFRSNSTVIYDRLAK